MRGSSGLLNLAAEATQIDHTEQDQHPCDAELQTHPEALRNDDPEKNDRSADDEQREAVSDAPENSGQRRAADLTLAAHDGGDRDDVIGIGSVPHAEKKPEEEKRDERHHNVTASVNLMDLMAHSLPSTASAALPHPGHSSVATGKPESAPSQYFGPPW